MRLRSLRAIIFRGKPDGLMVTFTIRPLLKDGDKDDVPETKTQIIAAKSPSS